MDINEFREDLISNVLATAEVEAVDPTSAFISYTIDLLKDAEEFDEFNEGYFEGVGKNNALMKMDGYYFDEYDKSFIVVISDFTSKIDNTILNMNSIDEMYVLMRNLIVNCANGYIKTAGFEESSSGYDLASALEEKYEEISKFRFYIISNKLISSRVKDIRKENIFGKVVDLNVWDATRLHQRTTATFERESIEIDFINSKMFTQGLKYLKVVDEQDYSAYLASISGNDLANLYLEFGSRLLEGNVRSFLNITGKVNKGIRNTIKNHPEMFFAYNNGIAATASSIEFSEIDNIPVISKINDLQIINGGQTTASLANSLFRDQADLSKIQVLMKLSVVEKDKAKAIIPEISRWANSQNKIDEADFSANEPYHIRMEEYSRRIYAPAKQGLQAQTLWFYERARGQYTQEQMQLSANEKLKFKLMNPKEQLIKKVDLAKYINSIAMAPHIVSKGAQANMSHFTHSIVKNGVSDTSVNELYFKNVISYAILFKETEILVNNQEWYKQKRAYRANIVTYSIALLMKKISIVDTKKSMNFRKIWMEQKLYPELIRQLEITTKEVFDFITSPDRLVQNVTEWCKKEACWTKINDVIFTIVKEFENSLIDENYSYEEIKEAKKERKLDNDINYEIKVVQLGSKYWKQVLEWGNLYYLLSPKEADIVKIACNFERTGKTPSSKQAKVILEINERLISEGMMIK